MCKTTKGKGAVAGCSSNRHTDKGREGCSLENRGKVESVWIDLGKFEVQNGVLLFDADQIPDDVQSIVWLSKSKCRDFQRRKRAEDVLPDSFFDRYGV